MRASMQTLMLTYMHARAYTRFLARTHAITHTCARARAHTHTHTHTHTRMQVFLEFNINNGFLVADHGVEQCERMLAFFHDEYNARVR